MLASISAREAGANGRPPGTSTINFKKGDESQILVGMTFGALASNDNGLTWRWVCEDAVGYGGMYDPDYAFSPTGSLFATTFAGLKIRRDACVFGPSPSQMNFVSTVTVGPDGAVYFASADQADGKVYRSSDDGVTFPISSKPGLSSDWWQSLEVAPSDPTRLYLSGYRFVPNPGGGGNIRVLLLSRSINAGTSWEPLPVSDFVAMPNSTIEIVGISKTNPDVVFARLSLEDNAISSAIYRSSNGGQSWTRILGKQDQISLLVRTSGELVAATVMQGTVRSNDNGASWQDLVNPPHINCLAENSAGEVWACTLNYPNMQAPSDGAGLMKSSDLVTWTKLLRYQDIEAPVDCPAGTAQRDQCDQRWCGLCAQLGCDPKRACPGIGDGARDEGPPSKGGCCETGGSSGAGNALLGAAIAGLLVRRRRRRGLRLGVLSASMLIASMSFSGVAHANGRPPLTNGVYFRPEDNKSMYIRSTFGLLVSHDEGCTFRWVCEQNIGYGGTFDPKYAIAKDGTLFATTFNGLRVSRDGGCSFTTATADLPAGDPGRIADNWVDALDISSTGEIWAATADSGKPNNVYRSTDGGLTFTPRGMLSPTIWWKSLKVAASDPLRVYISGYQIADPSSDAAPSPTTHLFATTDGGQSWTELPLAGIAFGSTPIVMVATVAPSDPQLIFLVSVGASSSTGDRLYRSTDGGLTFSEVLATSQPILDVVIRDASTVLVASSTSGTFRSDDGGATFTAMPGTPRLGCLGKRPDGTLIGCAANWDPDFMAVGRSADASQWQKIFRFVELAGPVSCPPGTAGHDVCDQELWPTLSQQFGTKGSTCGATEPPADGATEPPKSGGCCDARGDAPVGLALLGALTMWMVYLPRRRLGIGACGRGIDPATRKSS